MVLTIQAPAYASQPSVNYTPATTDLKAMLCSWGNFIYSFNCIVSVFVVKTSLKPLTQKRLSSTFSTTIFVILVFYSLIGLIGYVSLGDTVRDVDLIIERPALAGSSDIFMKIGIGRNLISYLFPSTRGFYCSHHSNQSTVHGTLWDRADIQSQLDSHNFLDVLSGSCGLVFSSRQEGFFNHRIFSRNHNYLHSSGSADAHVDEEKWPKRAILVLDNMCLGHFVHCHWLRLWFHSHCIPIRSSWALNKLLN